MKTKEDFFEHLSRDPAFSRLMSSLGDETQRRRVAADVRSFVGPLFDAIFPAFVEVTRDPAASTALSEALKSGEGIIRESDGAPIVSGSKI